MCVFPQILKVHPNVKAVLGNGVVIHIAEFMVCIEIVLLLLFIIYYQMLL